jgi:alkylhydroperoxidase/carboxymuconolactone decarboxylase family protein YurZ
VAKAKAKAKDEGTKLLEAMFAKRGYLLPYHRMLGASDPKLLAAYDALYTRLTLDERILTSVEKETVWIALIATTREKLAVFHFERAADAGMSNPAIGDALAIAAACESFNALFFGYSAFAKWVPEKMALKRYIGIFKAASGRTLPATAEIAATVCHAALRNANGMRIHLQRAFEAGASREQMAEALSYVLLHRGGPTMVDAVACWEKTAAELAIPGPY